MNVCRKDTKKNYTERVLCNRNLCKKQGEHKIVILRRVTQEVRQES